MVGGGVQATRGRRLRCSSMSLEWGVWRCLCGGGVGGREGGREGGWDVRRTCPFDECQSCLGRRAFRGGRDRGTATFLRTTCL